MTSFEQGIYEYVEFYLPQFNWWLNDLLKYGKGNFILFAVLIVLCVVILINQIRIKKQLRQLLEQQAKPAEPAKPTETADEP